MLIISFCLRNIESILGEVQLVKKEGSKTEALTLDIEENKKYDVIEIHECKIAGKAHGLLSILKGSYGN